MEDKMAMAVKWEQIAKAEELSKQNNKPFAVQVFLDFRSLREFRTSSNGVKNVKTKL